MLAEMPACVALAAVSRFAEASHLAIALPGARPLRAVFNLADEIGVQAEILLLPQEHTIGGQAIAAGAPCFLVILFHAFGQRQMNYRAHRGFVDAHPKPQPAHPPPDLPRPPFFL